MIHNTASHLYHQYGIRKGTIVTFYSSNSVEYAVMILAVWRLGAVGAFLNAMSTAGKCPQYHSLLM